MYFFTYTQVTRTVARFVCSAGFDNFPINVGFRVEALVPDILGEGCAVLFCFFPERMGVVVEPCFEWSFGHPNVVGVSEFSAVNYTFSCAFAWCGTLAFITAVAVCRGGTGVRI